MFTLSLNSETTNVTGVSTPCHSPSQTRGSSWPPAAAMSFAPGAQAARTSPPTTTAMASIAVLNRFMTPPSSLVARARLSAIRADGRPSWRTSPYPLHLPLDLLLAERRPVDVPGVEHQADAPAQHREHRPEEAGPGQRPDDQQRAVDEHVGAQVRAEVPLLPRTDGRLLAGPGFVDGCPQLGHGCHLLAFTVPPPPASRMGQKNRVRWSERPFGWRWSRSCRAVRPLAGERRPVTLDEEAEEEPERGGPEDDTSAPTATPRAARPTPPICERSSALVPA